MTALRRWATDFAIGATYGAAAIIAYLALSRILRHPTIR